MVHEQFQQNSSCRPNRVALVCGERRLTYADVDHMSDRLPTALLERGAEKGDLICMHNYFRRVSLSRPSVLIAPLSKGAFAAPLCPIMLPNCCRLIRIEGAGLFKPAAVSALFKHVMSGAALGETDGIAFAGILSTQLVRYHFVSHFRVAESRAEVKCSIIGVPAATGEPGTTPSSGTSNEFQ